MDQANTSEPCVVSLGLAASPKRIRRLKPSKPIDALNVSSPRLFGEKLARELSGWQPIKTIHLWTRATKAALRQLLAVPGIEEVNLSSLGRHSSLKGMPKSEALHTLRCGWLSSDDLREIADLPGLRVLGAQNSSLSCQAVSRLVGMKALIDLDLEGSDLTDELASILSTSTEIVSLSIGSTRVGPKGLQSICRMAQLRELDIWALGIQESDLDCLEALCNLEYLSVGDIRSRRFLRRREFCRGLPDCRR